MRYDIIKDLQLFAAGDVVNYSGNGTDANAGTYDTNLNTPVSTGDLSAEMKTFYEKSLLALMSPNLVHEQFGKKQPIPRHGGRNIEWRKFDKLGKALTPITEGVTPNGNKLVVRTINDSVSQYGDYIEQTDMLELTAIDNTIVEATKELAEQAALTLDTIVREKLMEGHNVYYAPKVVSGAETGGGHDKDVTKEEAALFRKDITAENKLRVKDIFRIAALLKAVNAPKIDGSYVMVIHPFVAEDLMIEAGDQWVDVNKYSNAIKIFRGEVGELAGVRFVESTEAKIYAPAVIDDGYSRLEVYEDAASAATSVKVVGELTAKSGVSIPCYIDGVANTITAITPSTGNGYSTLTVTALSDGINAGDMVCGQGAGKDGSAVFASLCLAKDAYGVTDLEGGGLEHIVKQRGYGNDPLNQRSSVGWKATKTAKILYEEYLIRVESGCHFSAEAEAN